MQLPWYVHSSSNYYNTFTSHSTLNQCGHLSYNRHNTFISHSTFNQCVHLLHNRHGMFIRMTNDKH
jgi:hypothetical protein